MEVLAPVRRLRARRELVAARRAADAELVATALPSPRFAWRTNELCSDEHRRALAESLIEVASGVGGSLSARRVAAQPARARETSWR